MHLTKNTFFKNGRLRLKNHRNVITLCAKCSSIDATFFRARKLGLT